MIPFFIVTSLAFLTPNLFYVSFIHYCSTYFKFVQLEIQRLNIDMAEEANDDERNLQQKLKMIVKAHQKALKFAGMLNRSMSFFMFAMCSALTMSVCFTAVRFTIVSNFFFPKTIDHIIIPFYTDAQRSHCLYEINFINNFHDHPNVHLLLFGN